MKTKHAHNGITLHAGPGLKILGQKTYGSFGGCNICGTSKDDLVPCLVRYWDCDDGWKAGVLCTYCWEDAAVRGPRKGDYAFRETTGDDLSREEKIDVLSEVLGDDADGVLSMSEDLEFIEAAESRFGK